ncbi:co-chaperone protein p23-1-like isoform X2 [Tripterygium wilfordii]|nr:co-chaperone protein p23-1-like isoform X2 [Tripterygium wilfordii]
MPYEVDFDLFDKVDVNESKGGITSRHISYLVKKAENKWWDRLLKQGGKPPVFFKVDWDKWVDEDEEQGNKFETDVDYGDLDFSKLNMGEGMSSGAAGLDDESDDSDTKEENLEGPSLSANMEEASLTEDNKASSTPGDASDVRRV